MSFCVTKKKTYQTFGFAYFRFSAKIVSVVFGWIRDFAHACVCAQNRRNSKHAMVSTSLMTSARHREGSKGLNFVGAILNVKCRHSEDETQYPKFAKVKELERCGKRTQTRHIDYKRVSP